MRPMHTGVVALSPGGRSYMSGKGINKDLASADRGSLNVQSFRFSGDHARSQFPCLWQVPPRASWLSALWSCTVSARGRHISVGVDGALLLIVIVCFAFLAR